MSADNWIIVGVLMGMMGFLAVTMLHFWYESWAITGVLILILCAVLVPMFLQGAKQADIEEKESIARMHRTCAPYGGVATQFEDPEQVGKSTVYHKLYMCKRGPRVVYER